MSYINPETPIFRPVPSSMSPVAGQTWVCQLPVGEVTYDAVTLIYKKAGTRATYAQSCADISKIRVKLNGTTVQEFTGTMLLDVLTNYLGHTLNNGELPIMFALPTARTPIIEKTTRLGTLGLKSATIEVDVAAGAGASLTIDTIAQCHLISEAPGWLFRHSLFTLTPSAAGQSEFKLETGLGPIAALHFSSSLITGLQLKKDQAIIVDGDLTFLQNTLKRYGRIPQTNYVHWEPTMRDNTIEAFPVADADDFRALLTTTAGGTVSLLYSSLWAPFGPPAQN